VVPTLRLNAPAHRVPTIMSLKGQFPGVVLRARFDCQIPRLDDFSFPRPRFLAPNNGKPEDLFRGSLIPNVVIWKYAAFR
jgi:hypothetical protein